MKKGGQITIFIIAGLILVGSVVLFFGFRSGVIPSIGGGAPANTNAFLSSCLEDELRNIVEELSLKGGYPNNPTSVNFKFEEEGVYRNITYLCYTQNNFRPCIVQKPAFFSDIQTNIENEIEDDVENCFNEMVESFESGGYDVVSERLSSFEINFVPKRILIETDSELTLSRGGETTTENDFQVIIPSRIYEILDIAKEIVVQESTYCYFESVGFQLAYPQFSLDLFRMEDMTEIYTLEHETTNEKFRFAVRGCSSTI